MTCTPGSLRNARSRNSYPSILGICTSTSTIRQWPLFTSFSASSGSDVGMASYPISAITADNISSCAGSSSRTHGVSEDFGATISTVFVEADPTMPSLLATHVPLPHLSTLLVPIIWQIPLPFYNSIENTAVIALRADKNRPCRRHYFQREAAPNPNCFSNHTSSRHFGPEIAPLFPLRHCASGKKVLTRSKVGEAALGRGSPERCVHKLSSKTYRRKIVRKRGNSSCSGSNASMTTRSIGPKM